MAVNDDLINTESPLMLRLINYGLTPETYGALLKKQGGTCAICKTRKSGGRGAWHIDHDHTCCAGPYSCGACVRGLLCARCNIGLGYFSDDSATLDAASAYLIAWAERP